MTAYLVIIASLCFAFACGYLMHGAAERKRRDLDAQREYGRGYFKGYCEGSDQWMEFITTADLCEEIIGRNDVVSIYYARTTRGEGSTTFDGAFVWKVPSEHRRYVARDVARRLCRPDGGGE